MSVAPGIPTNVTITKKKKYKKKNENGDQEAV